MNKKTNPLKYRLIAFVKSRFDLTKIKVYPYLVFALFSSYGFVFKFFSLNFDGIF